MDKRLSKHTSISRRPDLAFAQPGIKSSKGATTSSYGVESVVTNVMKFEEIKKIEGNRRHAVRLDINKLTQDFKQLGEDEFDLPKELNMLKLKKIVTTRLDFKMSLAKSVWRKYFIYSDDATQICSDIYWWSVSTFLFEEDDPEKQLSDGMHSRVSENYMAIFKNLQGLPPAAVDEYLDNFPDAVARVVYKSLQLIYPQYKVALQQRFRGVLLKAVYDWTTGTHPRSNSWKQIRRWRLLRPINSQTSQNNRYFELSSLSVEAEDSNDSYDEDSLSSEEETLEEKIDFEDKTLHEAQGPMWSRSIYELNHTPLFDKYARAHEMPGNRGVDLSLQISFIENPRVTFEGQRSYKHIKTTMRKNASHPRLMRKDLVKAYDKANKDVKPPENLKRHDSISSIDSTCNRPISSGITAETVKDEYFVESPVPKVRKLRRMNRTAIFGSLTKQEKNEQMNLEKSRVSWLEHKLDDSIKHKKKAFKTDRHHLTKTTNEFSGR